VTQQNFTKFLCSNVQLTIPKGDRAILQMDTDEDKMDVQASELLQGFAVTHETRRQSPTPKNIYGAHFASHPTEKTPSKKMMPVLAKDVHINTNWTTVEPPSTFSPYSFDGRVFSHAYGHYHLPYFNHRLVRRQEISMEWL
jgi:hypothetical protein